jgi:cytosine/adenosine deaminase-related metal-dependent hydrolase
VHLPTSNRFHKSGDFPFAKYVMAGAFPQVTLGTDSVISKSRLDLMSEGFQAKLMHQSSSAPAKFSDIFKMLTCNGARVIGQTGRLGRIAVGYQADLVFWKLKDRMFVPFDERHPETLLGNFIAHGGYVARDVMVNGQFVISGRRHNFVNESHLLRDLQKQHTALRRRLAKG